MTRTSSPHDVSGILYKIIHYTPTLLVISLVSSLVIMPGISYETNESQGVKWKLIFLSPYSGCTNYQYQMTDTYDEIATKYFELYKFSNTKDEPTCMPASKYSMYKPPHDLDLLILVYDYELGKKELNSYDLGGFYQHTGPDRSTHHTIVFCDCSNFKFSEPTWILSHELSHFILFYDGYDNSIAEDLIHKLGARHDYCNELSYDVSCKVISTQIHGTSYFTTVSVMKPYELAIGQVPMSVKTNDTIPVKVLGMQKEITKMWLAGKITDSDYVKLLGYAVDAPGYVMSDSGIKNDTTIVFADAPDFADQKKADDVSKWSKDKISTIFSRIPSGTITHDGAIPQWFKSRAMWWSQDKIWNDKEFVGTAKYFLGGK
jgi:hypothetical protein